MAQMHEIKGWCPTAYRPMATGDGLLLRLTPKWDGLSPEQLGVIAKTSLQFGNGQIDLTQRANLQIRGVEPDTYSKALSALLAHDLIDAKEVSEHQANILISPLSNLEKNKKITALKLATELNHSLVQNKLAQQLPSKFLFCINDCHKLSLYSMKSDILIDISDNEKISLILANDYKNPIYIEQHEILTSVIEITKRFLHLSEQNEFLFRRMHSLIEEIGMLELLKPLPFKTTPLNKEFNPSKDAYLGEITFNNFCFIGVSAPSGSWRAELLENFSQILIDHKSQNIRLTPWRSFLIPIRDLREGQLLLSKIKNLHLITSPDDPRLAAIACPGAPKCSQAFGNTEEVLERLSVYAADFSSHRDVVVHVSGCTKGCVKGDQTPLTIALTPQGYNLIKNGRADCAPFYQARSLEEIEHYMKNNLNILESP